MRATWESRRVAKVQSTQALFHFRNIPCSDKMLHGAGEAGVENVARLPVIDDSVPFATGLGDQRDERAGMSVGNVVGKRGRAGGNMGSWASSITEQLA